MEATTLSKQPFFKKKSRNVCTCWEQMQVDARVIWYEQWCALREPANAHMHTEAVEKEP